MHSLAILYPGCVEFEIALAIELLARAMPVRVATPDRSPHKGAGGVRWHADHAYADAPAQGLVCLVIPGGDPGSVVHNPDLRRLIIDADTRSCAIGAICAGPLLLGDAGILATPPRRTQGHEPPSPRRITHGYAAAQMPFVAPFFQGAVVEDRPLVRDGNIITARPTAYVPFAVELALAAGALDSSPDPRGQRDRLLAYYASGVPTRTAPAAPQG